METSAECWTQIRAYPDYEVSNAGSLRSSKRQKPTRMWVANDGHVRAILNHAVKGLDGSSKYRSVTVKVHNIVAEEFLPAPSRRGRVLHKNGEKSDNRVANLYWEQSAPGEFALTATETAAYIAGFVDGDGSIFINRIRDGFQLMVSITQCHQQLLKEMNHFFETKGELWRDMRAEKYTRESASSLRFCGKQTVPILEACASHGIIKSEQANLALEFIPLINQPGTKQQKQEMCQKMKALNKDKTAYRKPYGRLCNAYIAGLYDAEGCVYSREMGTKVKFYIKITQKSDPMLLQQIRAFLGYGNIAAKEDHTIKFESYAAIVKFKEVVSLHSKIKLSKHNQLIQLLERPEYLTRKKRVVL